MIKSKYFKFIGSALLISLVLAGCGQKQQSQATPQAETKTKNTTSYIFTANEGGSISKIDASTNKVVDTIKIEGVAHNLQISPDGKIIGVTNMPVEEKSGDDSMNMNMNMKGFALFYNAESDTLVKKVQVGDHPAHIVFTNDGKYAIGTNNMDNNVSVIDTSNYNIAKVVSVGKGPHGFRISKDSKFAYVANMGEDTVSVIDVDAGKEVRKIKVGKTPVTTGVTSDGKTLVATVNGENALAIVDLATDKVEKVTVGVGPAQVYIQSDDKFAFVANQGTEDKPSDTVSKIDMSTKQVVATIKTGKGAHGVVTSDDNKFVYVTNMYDNTVSVIDTAQNKVVSTISVGKTPNGITFKK